MKKPSVHDGRCIAGTVSWVVSDEQYTPRQKMRGRCYIMLPGTTFVMVMLSENPIR
jgi:hypothetical protein